MGKKGCKNDYVDTHLFYLQELTRGDRRHYAAVAGMSYDCFKQKLCGARRFSIQELTRLSIALEIDGSLLIANPFTPLTRYEQMSIFATTFKRI